MKLPNRIEKTKISRKSIYNLLVPENILSAIYNRELKMRICLYPNNINNMHRNTMFDNENQVKNGSLDFKMTNLEYK